MGTAAAETDLMKTLHIDSDELPFIEFEPGVEGRVLHVRLDEAVVVTQARSQPGVVSPLHRHPEPVYAWTLRGAWGHDQRFLYRPGTYVFETPGVAHRFFCGPEVAEAVFITTGNIEWLDPETQEVTRVSTPEARFKAYVQACGADVAAKILR
jgi:2,4'-dihydroxyacetophenone dioxygenase